MDKLQPAGPASDAAAQPQACAARREGAPRVDRQLPPRLRALHGLMYRFAEPEFVPPEVGQALRKPAGELPPAHLDLCNALQGLGVSEEEMARIGPVTDGKDGVAPGKGEEDWPWLCETMVLETLHGQCSGDEAWQCLERPSQDWGQALAALQAHVDRMEGCSQWLPHEWPSLGAALCMLPEKVRRKVRIKSTSLHQVRESLQAQKDRVRRGDRKNMREHLKALHLARVPGRYAELTLKLLGHCGLDPAVLDRMKPCDAPGCAGDRADPAPSKPPTPATPAQAVREFILAVRGWATAQAMPDQEEAEQFHRDQNFIHHYLPSMLMGHHRDLVRAAVPALEMAIASDPRLAALAVRLVRRHVERFEAGLILPRDFTALRSVAAALMLIPSAAWQGTYFRRRTVEWIAAWFHPGPPLPESEMDDAHALRRLALQITDGHSCEHPDRIDVGRSLLTLLEEADRYEAFLGGRVAREPNLAGLDRSYLVPLCEEAMSPDEPARTPSDESASEVGNKAGAPPREPDDDKSAREQWRQWEQGNPNQGQRPAKAAEFEGGSHHNPYHDRSRSREERNAMGPVNGYRSNKKLRRLHQHALGALRSLPK